MKDIPQRRMPFQGLSFEQWWRLALIAITVTYVLLFAMNVKALGLFNYVGLDYRSFLVSAQIGVQEGFSKIYNLGIQEKYQSALYETYRAGTNAPPFATAPMLYFPVFVLPFFLLLPFSAPTGFAIYTLASIGICILYLKRLLRIFQVGERHSWIILAALASSWLFYNFIFGQVSFLMLIFLGEFLVALTEQRDMRAGLWLAGLCVKPQMLMFLLPWLFFSRRYRAILGFALGAAGLFIVSALMAGWDWFFKWAELLLVYQSRLATANPYSMINWRTLALNLGSFLPSAIAWTIAVLGIGVTTFYVVRTWKKWDDKAQLASMLLCNYAGTCIVSWHSHVHVAAPLLAPLIFLMKSGALSRKGWAAIIGLQFLGVAASIMIAFWGTTSNLVGIASLAIIFYLTVWASRKADQFKGPARDGQATTPHPP